MRLSDILLAPYTLALKARHASYDKGKKKSVRAAMPTICVGNITVGGTGKTPHTEMLLEMLAEEFPHKRAAVLSRGYGRKSHGFLEVLPEGPASRFGDEPLQIKRKYPSVDVCVDENRVEGCSKLEGKADVVILDDAFQYRKLDASLKIVLVDYNRPICNDTLLPFGSLRDLPERIYAADIIIVTKSPSDLTEKEKKSFLKSLGKVEVPVLFTTIEYCPLQCMFADGEPRYSYAPEAYLFSGIAVDKPLRDYLLGSFRIVGSHRFADHHNYNRSDLRMLSKEARKHPHAVFVSTEKDMQKLSAMSVPETLRKRLMVAPIKVRFIDPADREILLQALKQLL